MASARSSASQSASLDELADYQRDAEASLQLYFSNANPAYVALFAASRQSEVAEKLTVRVKETEVRSTLALLALIEAAFRLDFQWRRDAKKSDLMSVEFRKYRKKNVRLDEDIWEVWCDNHPATRALVSQLRGAFKYRHWVAHGRYWQMGSKYDYQTVFLLAQAILITFPLFS